MRRVRATARTNSRRPDALAAGMADRHNARSPERWESGAAGPFLWIETARGSVEVWALGEDRFRVTAPGHEQLVTGYDEAERTADALAEQLE